MNPQKDEVSSVCSNPWIQSSGLGRGGGGGMFRLAFDIGEGETASDAAASLLFQWMRTLLPHSQIVRGGGGGGGGAVGKKELVLVLLFRASRVRTVLDAVRQGDFKKEDVVQMIDQLGQQVAYFKKQYSHGWIGLREHDVLQICGGSISGEPIYVLANVDLLFPCKKSGVETVRVGVGVGEGVNLCVNEALPSDVTFPGFCLDDVKKELPFWVPFGAVYYSLGTFLQFCLGLGGGEEKNKYWPKMHWFIQRCLRADPEKRMWLYL